MKSRRPLAEMRAAADALVIELTPYCERIEIAGSIRRGVPMPADIELVCVPVMKTVPMPREVFGDFFVPQDVTIDVLKDYCERRLGEKGAWDHRLDKNGRPAFGRKFKRLLIDDVAVDLFSVLPPAQFAVIFLIRTGPAEFSKQFVTQRRKGGVLPDDYVVRDGAVWRGETLIPMAEEAEFFRFCGVKYLEPESRR